MYREEVCHELGNQNAVGAKESAQPGDVLWFVFVYVEIVNENLVIVFAFDCLERFDGVNFDQRLDEVLADIA
jgi:hypothetical protein